MRNTLIGLLGILLFCSHDMYLKLDTYFIAPDQAAEIYLFNGTFEKSENVITRDRMLDASLVGNGKRYTVNEGRWSEKDSTTILSFQSGKTGTWVAGVSTAARNIEMEADAFNNYLEHDGVMDMLKWRQENNAMDQDAIEKYSKHVKVLFQVGDTRSDDWSTLLGYPIEFVPSSNPYELHTGDTLEVKLLFQGQPLANQLVYADYRVSEHEHTHKNAIDGKAKPHAHEDHSHGHSHKKQEKHEHGHADEAHSHEEKGHSHSHDGKDPHVHETAEDTKEENHQHTSGQQLRTDEAGLLSLKLTADGIWYLRTIHLVNSEEEGLTHESNWATLTFEVTHDHDVDKTHSHSHEEEGFPTYLFWIGSVVVLGGLFFWFNRKK